MTTHTNTIGEQSRGLLQQANDIGHVTNSLKERKFFKLVCGASLDDINLVENLVYVFTLAGAHVVDLAASADVIFAARRGMEKAINHQPSTINPLLMASIQIDKDPHFRKIEVDYAKCDLCSACVKVCPTEAFKIVSKCHSERSEESNCVNRSFASAQDDNYAKEFLYSIERCYGCGICPSYCHVNALSLIDTNPTPKQTLQEMIDLDVKSIEFHFGKGYVKLKDIWSDIKELVKKLDLISFSIGSDLLTPEEIKEAARLCHELAGEGIIIQCDGTPMSGGKKTGSGNNNDKSSLEVAKIIEELKLPVFLQISGGTDEKSFSRAEELGLKINGVAIGSYARKLVMPYLKDLNNKDNLENATKLAKSLVNSVTLKY
jgi:ferredoxin